MPQKFADIGWSHPHFVHPGRCGSACSMRGDAPYYIGLADSGELTQQWDHAHIEEMLAHQFLAVLEEVVRWLSCLSINQRLLVWWSHSFPDLNGIRYIERYWHIKIALHFVNWHTQVGKLSFWLDKYAVFIMHLRCPFSTDTPYLEPPNFIGSPRRCHPNQTGRSIIGQRIDRNARSL